jgi:hypothetical protein
MVKSHYDFEPITPVWEYPILLESKDRSVLVLATGPADKNPDTKFKGVTVGGRSVGEVSEQWIKASFQVVKSGKPLILENVK